MSETLRPSTRLGGELVTGMDAARRPTRPVIAILIVLGAVLIGQIVFPVVFALFGLYGLRKGSLGWQLYSTVLIFAGMLLTLYLWVRLKERRPFATVGFRSRPSRIGLGAVAGLVMFGVIVLVGLAAGQFRVESVPGGLTAAAVGGVALALAGFAVQGSTEEIFTRGYLMQAAARRWGLVAAVATQAVLFALLHGLNPGVTLLAIVNLVLVALFLAGWALLEGGLWGVCAWHAVWNWTQGNVWGLLVSGQAIDASLLRTRPTSGATDLLTGGAFGPEGGLVTTVVLLAGIAVLYLLRRRRSDR